MLIGNRSVLLKSPGRNLAGTVASTDRAGWAQPGMMRSAAYPALAGLPNGYYEAAWFLPKGAGALSSTYNARLDISPAGLAVGGVTSPGSASLTFTPAATAWPLDDSVQIRTASASITFTVADAAGQLISNGSGSAGLTFSTNAPSLTASIEGIGTASFSLLPSGFLSADASIEGTASVSFGGTGVASPTDDTPPARTAAASMAFSMAATILPTNDSPPARTASANFAITGGLTPYAIGSMVGSTLNTSALTTDTIAAAVWQSLAASFADAGTMGQKLNNAASGGVDYNDLASAVWNHTQ